MNIRDLRLKLVDDQDALRRAKDLHTLVKAEAEQRAIDAAGGEKNLGANEAARARALILALAQDKDYNEAAGFLRLMETTVARSEAELESMRDAVQEGRWTIRARLADALLARGAEGVEADPHDDAADAFVADALADIEALRKAAWDGRAARYESDDYPF